MTQWIASYQAQIVVSALYLSAVEQAQVLLREIQISLNLPYH